MSDPLRRYTVLLERQPQKILRRLPRDLLCRIDSALLGLASDPRPPACIKLVGYETLYRLRVGDWRIIYAIEEDALIVLVIEIAPRAIPTAASDFRVTDQPTPVILALAAHVQVFLQKRESTLL